MKGSNKNIVENNDVNTIYNNNATQKTSKFRYIHFFFN